MHPSSKTMHSREALRSPVRALRLEESPLDLPEIDEEDAPDDAANDRHLVCAGCRNPITHSRYRTAREGQHRHVFFNPHGLVFEIGCFSQASGCLQAGRSTSEFTWFPGYAWQITLCSACTLHLGWRFQSEDGDGFYGFILSCLLEQPP